MKRKLSGARIIITGASSGIGRELAIQLAAAGAKLVITARREDRLNEVKNECGGAPVEIVAGDITHPETREAVIHRAHETYGGLDILINNAGATASGLFEENSPETLRKVLDLNVVSLVEMTRLALPMLKRLNQTEASAVAPMIVNLSSIVGIHGVTHYSEYCGAKAMVRVFSQSLRIELRRYGIDVLVVCPGSTETEFFTRYIENASEPVFPPHKRVSPAYVARRIIRAMKAGKREIIPFSLGRVMRFMDYFAPGLMENFMADYEEKAMKKEKKD